jgi:rSAM/selenodomain-associated transferase 1
MVFQECLLLYTKWPELGNVKTRLAADIGDKHAVGLYRCFILDMLAVLTQNPQPVYICYTPADTEANFRHWLGPAYHYLPQYGADLGDRMQRSFHHVFQCGVQSACLIGSDLPALPSEYVNEAFTRLHQHDSVIGRADDGGYYLIGFRRETFFPEIFQGIPWSQPTVYQATLAKYRQRGTRFFPLFSWVDIVYVQEMGHWFRLYLNVEYRAPSTVAYIRCHLDGLTRDAD